MKQASRLGLAALVMSFATFTGAQAAMPDSEYSASKSRIKADYDAAVAQCKSLSGNAKDICREEAKGKEKVAKAELEYSRTGKSEDARKLTLAKADATYAVAKEKCDDFAGNQKDVCRSEAKAQHTKAMADVKLNEKTAEARTDAVTRKTDADYKVAIEKCDALAGDAKDACVKSAKAQYGRN